MNNLSIPTPVGGKSPDMLTRKQAAEFLGLTVGTLAKWASLGKGVRYYKTSGVRGTTFYSRDDLEAYKAQQTVSVGGGV